jgi:hypothetical protein
MEPNATPLVLNALRSPEEPVGTLAFPVRDQMNTSTVFSILATDRSDLGPLDILALKGSILTLQRNALIQHMRGDWILFIDDDMVWPQDAVKRLIASLQELRDGGIEPDVLGALCFRREHPYQPTLYVRDGPEGAYNFLETWDTDYVDVDATGMAFALITKRCLERLTGSGQPPYEERIRQDRYPDFFEWTGRMGEDLRFCSDVKRFGGRIMVDTRLEIAHVGEILVGNADFLQALASRPTSITKARKEVNDKMGLPTMTRSAAKGKLRG